MINQARESWQQAKALKTHIDRRNRLWAQVKANNPAYTQAELEARLEQFGV